jgi:hypothetical protein
MIEKGQDSFIDSLVAELKPTKPLDNFLILGIAAVGFIAIVAIVIISLGLRPDFSIAMHNGTIMWKNGGLFLGAIAAIVATIALSRPDTKPGIIVPVLLFVISCIIIWRVFELGNTNPILIELMNINFGGAQFCVPTIFIGGSVIFAFVWNVWIKHTASSDPKALGASAGLMSALTAGCAYSFHCNMDGIFYYIACYWLPALALSAFGYFMGKKLVW